MYNHWYTYVMYYVGISFDSAFKEILTLITNEAYHDYQVIVFKDETNSWDSPLSKPFF